MDLKWTLNKIWTKKLLTNALRSVTWKKRRIKNHLCTMEKKMLCTRASKKRILQSNSMEIKQNFLMRFYLSCWSFKWIKLKLRSLWYFEIVNAHLENLQINVCNRLTFYDGWFYPKFVLQPLIDVISLENSGIQSKRYKNWWMFSPYKFAMNNFTFSLTHFDLPFSKTSELATHKHSGQLKIFVAF